MDAFETTHGYASHPGKLGFPSGFVEPIGMTSGVTASGDRLLFVIRNDRLLAYRPKEAPGGPPEMPVDDVPLPGDVTRIHLSLDGRFLLLTRYPRTAPAIQSLLVLDADTRLAVRDSMIAACPGGVCPIVVGGDPMALTIDGSHAIVSSQETNELKYVYLAPPREVTMSNSLGTIVAAVPPEDFARPGDQQRLLTEVDQVTRFLDLAEQVPPGPAEQALLADAQLKLGTVTSQVDGCLGGDPTNDLILDTACAEKRDVLGVATDLSTMIATQQIPSSCPPTIP